MHSGQYELLKRASISGMVDPELVRISISAGNVAGDATSEAA